MATFVITYDLLAKGQDYTGLSKELKRLGAKRPLLSVWTLKSDSTAAQLCAHVRKFVDGNDRVLVAQMSSWAWDGPVLEEPHRD